MCGGATDAQTTVQDQDIETMKTYAEEQKQNYANQQDIYAKVSSVLDPILKAGANQEGFSGAEKNNLNAQAVEGTAQNYASAARAVNEQLASAGGGSSQLTTGAQAELKQQVASSAAQEQSKEETEITEENYKTGRENFQNAEQGELAIASGEDPVGYANAATGAANAAGNEANTIAAQGDAWENALIGAAGSIGAGFASDFSF